MNVLHVLCDRILGNSLLDELRLAVVLLHMVLRGLHLRPGTKSPPVQALGKVDVPRAKVCCTTEQL